MIGDEKYGINDGFPKTKIVGKRVLANLNLLLNSDSNHGIEGLDFKKNGDSTIAALLFEGYQGNINPCLYFFEVGQEPQQIVGLSIPSNEFQTETIRATSVRFVPDNGPATRAELLVMVQDTSDFSQKWIAKFDVRLSGASPSIQMAGAPVPLSEMMDAQDVVRNWEGMAWTSDAGHLMLVNDNASGNHLLHTATAVSDLNQQQKSRNETLIIRCVWPPVQE